MTLRVRQHGAILYHPYSNMACNTSYRASAFRPAKYTIYPYHSLLVGWFFHILGISSSQLTIFFQRGRSTTNQIVTKTMSGNLCQNQHDPFVIHLPFGLGHKPVLGQVKHGQALYLVESREIELPMFQDFPPCITAKSL